MAITPTSFRMSHVEFFDVVVYPDSVIAYWAAVGAMLLNVDRWGEGATTASSPPTTIYDVGLELFVAHNIVIDKMANDAAATGATPGLSQGPVSSKSVNGVSVSYDTQAGIESDAGHWNLTTYGTRFKRLLNMMGAGPIQFSGNTYGSLGSAGWPGPTTMSGLNW